MSNHHLRNKELSLKARGFCRRCCPCRKIGTTPLRDCPISTGKVSTRSAPPYGSLKKPDISQGGRDADEKGKMAAIEYTIYEQPQPPSLENPILENPTTDKPVLENPTTENPTSDNPTQINKEEQRTDLASFKEAAKQLNANRQKTKHKDRGIEL